MNTKPCIACHENIHIDALKCPHCHQVQSKVANLPNKPYFNYLIIAVLLFFVLWFTYYIAVSLMQDPLEPVFDIGTSNLINSESADGSSIRCVAEIKNPSLRRWDNFTLQAAFYNAQDQVIDVHYAGLDVTLYPQFHFIGIVAGVARAQQDAYARCEISVINANDY